MSFKEHFSKISNWLKGGEEDSTLYQEPVSVESAGQVQEDRPEGQSNHITVTKVESADNKAGLEVLGRAFNKLVDQLDGINTNLAKQVSQHEELMGRIEQLPEMLESLPTAVDSQKAVVESLIEQLKGRGLRDEQFTETIQKIPATAEKQTKAMSEVSQKMSVCADVNVQMSENFNHFRQNLEKLDKTTEGQAAGLDKLAETFSASQTAMKEMMDKQTKRFIWLFIAVGSVSLLAIAALVWVVMRANA